MAQSCLARRDALLMPHNILPTQQRSCHAPRSIALRIQASAEAPTSTATFKAVSLLKQAAKDKSVDGKALAVALIDLEKAAKSGKPATDDVWLEGLGGNKSPGKKWRLVLASNGKTDPAAALGNYFPLNARQRFDAVAMEIENGVFLGPVGYLTFKGPFSFKARRLSFLFDTLTLKVGPFPEFQFNIGAAKDKGRTPGEGKEGRDDPFFVWFYVDDEVIAGRGRGGGVAFWSNYDRE